MHTKGDRHVLSTVVGITREGGGGRGSVILVKGDKHALSAAMWCAWMPWERRRGRERRRRTLPLPLGCN